MKFRPANNSVAVDHPLYESFIYGNNAGIYQPKYGLQSYEFCYLRHADTDIKITGLGGGKNDVKPNAKVMPNGGSNAGQPSQYTLLDRFSSNSIKIGTFNIFMNLTCDMPLLGPNEKLNLSWIIYGVDYSILSNPKCRNCIAFYRIESESVTKHRGKKNSNRGGESEKSPPTVSSGCAKIEAVPTSAYLEVDDNEPCPGRMVVTAPPEPGMYEVRFLFNFFKKAQLHRQCQVFGELEDQMQELRIRSFFEKRAVTDELRKFTLRESKRWGIARMNTFVWLRSMLLSTLREPVSDEMKESTTEYGEFLFGRLKRKLQRGLQNPSPVFQRRLALMIAPLQRNAFMDVLMVAFASSAQANDQLASITFSCPSDEDQKNYGLNRFRDMVLLPSDNKIFMRGDVGFRPLALNYLRQQSLCGFHDFVDDIVLTHAQLLKTVDQLMKDLSSGCVALYESPIKRAIQAMMDEAKVKGLENVLQGIDVLLEDLCRNHMQSIVRSFLETDCRTGLKWKGPPKGTHERRMALISSTVLPGADPTNPLPFTLTIDGAENAEKDKARELVPPVDSLTPVTRQHLAVRKWIFPRLTRKIMGQFRQRYARMMNANLPIVMDLARAATSCIHPGLALAGNPFPNHRAMQMASPLYFMGEARVNRENGTNGGDKHDPEDDLDDEAMKNYHDDNNDDDIDDSEANMGHDANGDDDNTDDNNQIGQ